MVESDVWYTHEDIAVEYLLERGFRRSKRMFWLTPCKEYKPYDIEVQMIEFLCDRYDNGGIAGYVMSGNKAMEFSFIIDLQE